MYNKITNPLDILNDLHNKGIFNYEQFINGIEKEINKSIHLLGSYSFDVFKINVYVDGILYFKEEEGFNWSYIKEDQFLYFVLNLICQHYINNGWYSVDFNILSDKSDLDDKQINIEFVFKVNNIKYFDVNKGF